MSSKFSVFYTEVKQSLTKLIKKQNKKGDLKMPLLKPKAKKAELAPVAPTKSFVPVVDVSTNPDTGGRILTLYLPPSRVWTDEMLDELAEERDGERPIAICDISDEPIFNNKNVNKIDNDERKEFSDIVISTQVLNMLLEAVGKKQAKVAGGKPSAKKN